MTVFQSNGAHRLDAGSEAVPRSGFFWPARVRWGLFLGRAGRGMPLPLLGLLNPAQAPLWPAFFLRPGCAARCFWPARVRWALFLAGQGALGAVFAGQGALGAVFGARGAGPQNATSPTGSTGYSPGHGRGAVWPVPSTVFVQTRARHGGGAERTSNFPVGPWAKFRSVVSEWALGPCG
jgi:hypothetical protein